MRIKILGMRECVDHEFTLEQYEQALTNHNQSLERLHQRGGLSWCELAAILYCVPWQRINKKYTNDMWRKHLAEKFGLKVISL